MIPKKTIVVFTTDEEQGGLACFRINLYTGYKAVLARDTKGLLVALADARTFGCVYVLSVQPTLFPEFAQGVAFLLNNRLAVTFDDIFRPLESMDKIAKACKPRKSTTTRTLRDDLRRKAAKLELVKREEFLVAPVIPNISIEQALTDEALSALACGDALSA